MKKFSKEIHVMKPGQTLNYKIAENINIKIPDVIKLFFLPRFLTSAISPAKI